MCHVEKNNTIRYTQHHITRLADYARTHIHIVSQTDDYRQMG